MFNRTLNDAAASQDISAQDAFVEQNRQLQTRLDATHHVLATQHKAIQVLSARNARLLEIINASLYRIIVGLKYLIAHERACQAVGLCSSSSETIPMSSSPYFFQQDAETPTIFRSDSRSSSIAETISMSSSPNNYSFFQQDAEIRSPSPVPFSGVGIDEEEFSDNSEIFRFRSRPKS